MQLIAVYWRRLHCTKASSSNSSVLRTCISRRQLQTLTTFVAFFLRKKDLSVLQSHRLPRASLGIEGYPRPPPQFLVADPTPHVRLAPPRTTHVHCHSLPSSLLLGSVYTRQPMNGRFRHRVSGRRPAFRCQIDPSFRVMNETCTQLI